MTERRTATRRRTLKGGKIVFNNGWGSIRCIVKTMSETGARLQVESVLEIPNVFTLMFDDGGRARECIVRWREPASLGVEFSPLAD